jgi:integration host factor subunit beta
LGKSKGILLHHEPAMTKSELTTRLAEKAGLSRSIAGRVVDQIFDTMIESFRQGESVYIRGFGSLMVRHYAPYIGRNPKTGVRVSVDARRVPVFIVSEEMRQRVAAGGQAHARIVHRGPGIPRLSTAITGEWSQAGLEDILEEPVQTAHIKK